MKLIVTGYARHGKDSVCKILQRDHGLTFESSSMFCALRAVKPWLAVKGITYASDAEMYEDRINHRADWYDAICEYNSEDKARLVKELFRTYDVYCGLRNREELLAAKSQGIVDFVIWVDASLRLPPEDSSSITVGPEDCDFILDNNGLEEMLPAQVSLAHRAASASTKRRKQYED